MIELDPGITAISLLPDTDEMPDAPESPLSKTVTNIPGPSSKQDADSSRKSSNEP